MLIPILALLRYYKNLDKSEGNSSCLARKPRTLKRQNVYETCEINNLHRPLENVDSISAQIITVNGQEVNNQE